MRVLAIDGGGIRGVIPAMVLAELERRAGRPVSRLFDLIAGTSTGGILATALTIPGTGDAPRWKAADLVGLYVKEGPRIFHRSLWRLVESVGGLLDEKHDDGALNSALRHYLGDARLSQALTPILVTSYDLESRRPYLFKSWRAARDPARDFPMWTVARATSAAPTYFEPLRVEPPDGSAALALVDGGVFASNPGMSAYAEARRLWPDRDLLVVSLGTGQHTRPIHWADAKDWGLLEWARPVIDVVLDGVADTVEYELRQLLPAAAYHRFQVALTKASDALDDAGRENLEHLQEQARELIAAREKALDEVARLLTAPP